MADHPVALITGAARRIGAEIADTLHQAGFNVVLHYNRSGDSAKKLEESLNSRRTDSAYRVQADLCNLEEVEALAQQSIEKWRRIDALVNNASSFYPTHVGAIQESDWDDLMSTNLKAPLFLSQALAPELRIYKGAIVNIADIHGERPLSYHVVYSIAKAGNIMLTKSLAKELAPHVRVNGVSPGAILWPEHDTEFTEETKKIILDRTALERIGAPKDIAQTVKFLLLDAAYITGQILAVDGGRSLVS